MLGFKIMLLQSLIQWLNSVRTCGHWHRLVKNIGGTKILGGSTGGNNWWKHRRFSIIGGTCVRAAPQSLCLCLLVETYHL